MFPLKGTVDMLAKYMWIGKHLKSFYLSLYMPPENVLYPWGLEVGDVRLPLSTADGNSPYITPPVGFPFMGKFYERLFVSRQVLKVTFIEIIR